MMSKIIALLTSLIAISNYFYTVPTDNLADFMQVAGFFEGNKKWSDITIIGSHDAGTYSLQNCTFGAGKRNVQTQSLNFYQQLSVGVRFFDIRPSESAKNQLVSFHATHSCFPKQGMGCLGADLNTICEDTKRFLSKHKEILIFACSHFCNENLQTRFIQEVAVQLKDFLYIKTTPEKIGELPLSEIIKNRKQGVVIILIYGNVQDALPEGIYTAEEIRVYDHYANKNDSQALFEDQYKKWKEYDAQKNNMFLLSWTATQTSRQTIIGKSIRSMAKDLEKKLPTYWAKFKRDGKQPNIISVDFIHENYAKMIQTLILAEK